MESAWQPHRDTPQGQLLLERAHVGDAEVEDAGRQRRMRLARLKYLSKVLRSPGAPGGNHRNLPCLADPGGQLTIEARPCAIGIHRGQQDLTRSPRFGFARPFDHLASRTL